MAPNPSNNSTPVEKYDVIIVGANIIGAGVAREASLRGLKVVLINMEDFASGSNSNPGENILGVDRYVSNADLGLSKDDYKERKILQNIAPQLIKDQTFIIPQTREQNDHLKKKFFAPLLNFFTGVKEEKPEILKNSDLEDKLYGIDSKTYPRGLLFNDSNVNDYRLTMTNILDSLDYHGRQLNYWYVDKIAAQSDHTIMVTAKDMITGAEKFLEGAVLINTTGPYSNFNLKKWGVPFHQELRIKKSFHFFLPTINEQYGIIIPTDHEKKVIYAVPMENATLVGISDYKMVENLEVPKVSKTEIQFVLDQLNKLFPDKKLTIDQVFGPMAGLKSYINDKNYEIFVDQLEESKIISVIGGKMILYRKIAEEVVDKAVNIIGKKVSSSESDSTRMRGSQFRESTFKSFVEHRLISNLNITQLPIDVSMNLLRIYGTQINDFDFVPFLKEKAGTERIFPGTKHIWAQFYYSIHHEFVRKPSDFALHRTYLFLDLLNNPEHIPTYFQKAGEILNFTADQIKEDQQKFLDTFKIEK